jgi:aminopeptidase
MMTDIRMQRLAKLLIGYSVRVKEGDWVIITGDVITEPLMNLVVKEVLLAGGNPEVRFSSDKLQETRLEYATEKQLSFVSPLERMAIEKVDGYIYLMGDRNTRTLSAIDPAKQQASARARRDLSEIMMKRSATDDLRWVITQFPCDANAQEADMSLKNYEDFVYKAVYCHKENPVAEWLAIHEEQDRIIKWLTGKKKIAVKSANADVTLSIEGRSFINSSGKNNMPSGEIYTSPVEDSVNGWVKFTYPAITNGREVSGIELKFKDGKVVHATAQKNEEFLLSQLDVDEGSRYLGEFAIGTNYGIQQFTKNILYDEKIGGSFHMAVGNGFLEAGSKNVSAIHWDMICDMRDDGEISADGEIFYQNGKFII